MKLKEGFVLRQVAGEYVAIPSGAQVDLNRMITLNATGAFLWEKLNEETDRQALIAALQAEYEVDEVTAAAAVDSFVDRLKNYELLD